MTFCHAVRNRNADACRVTRAVQAELDKASETARQHGVYPGVVRDLRRRHRLIWAGWDR